MSPTRIGDSEACKFQQPAKDLSQQGRYRFVSYPVLAELTWKPVTCAGFMDAVMGLLTRTMRSLWFERDYFIRADDDVPRVQTSMVHV
jgi:hypothetical protein